MTERANERLKVGVIGCGAIAQVQHLPHLRELSDQFEIAGLCDLSPKLLQAVGDEYGVARWRRFTDFNELVKSDVDAVIVCPSGTHSTPTIAAANAGKHVLVEKPMCPTVAEARAMVEAADRNGVVLMSAYPKRHEPAFEFAQARIAEMFQPRYVQANHLHPDNSLHLRDFRVVRFDDVPADIIAASNAEHREAIARELGYPTVGAMPEAIHQAYAIVLGSMIHDIANLHGLFGNPRRVISTEIWAEGRGITTTLEYANELRAVCTWVDLPVLWDFEETLGVYGPRDRVVIDFPTGFSRGLPTTVTVQGIDAEGNAFSTTRSWHDNPFKLELLKFRDCVVNDMPAITPGREAVEDVKLVGDIIRAFL
ncbi:MAG: Gfo/Idh/MocA family oxidoreductase [Chloroflexota bacterium]